MILRCHRCYSAASVIVVALVAVTAFWSDRTTTTTNTIFVSGKQLQEHISDNYKYNKLDCTPRSHNFNPTSGNTDSNTTRAPDAFLVQFTITTTTTTSTTSESPSNNNNNNNNNNNDNILTFVVQFNRSWAPIGVDRFYQLAILDHYYDCAVFFRVIPYFVTQFGIASEPNETQKWDIIIPDDTSHTGAILQSNVRGTISYATAGPNTRTAQLFINTKDNPNLDYMGFTPIGKIVPINPNNNDDDSDDPITTVISKIAVPRTKPNEDGIDQGDYERYGNSWLLQHYPDVDLIINTTIINETTTVANTEPTTIATESFTTTSTTAIGREKSIHDDESTAQQYHRFRYRSYDD